MYLLMINLLILLPAVVVSFIDCNSSFSCDSFFISLAISISLSDISFLNFSFSKTINNTSLCINILIVLPLVDISNSSVSKVSLASSFSYSTKQITYYHIRILYTLTGCLFSFCCLLLLLLLSFKIIIIFIN